MGTHADCSKSEYCGAWPSEPQRCFVDAVCGNARGGTPIDEGQCPPIDGTQFGPPFYLWPVVLGLLVFSAVLVCWQPKEDVFLDKVCIHQTDLHKKQQGIDGLGGFLHYSGRMIIFWDRTYFKRLWCVFELAAYLHMKGATAKISVVPIIRGYVTVAAIFLN